jgi:hypothetical protein
LAGAGKWLFSLDAPNLFGYKRRKPQFSMEACADGVLMRGLGRPSKIIRILASRQGTQHGVVYFIGSDRDRDFIS